MIVVIVVVVITESAVYGQLVSDADASAGLENRVARKFALALCPSETLTVD